MPPVCCPMSAMACRALRRAMPTRSALLGCPSGSERPDRGGAFAIDASARPRLWVDLRSALPAAARLRVPLLASLSIEPGELSRTPYRGPSMRAGPAPLPSRHPWIGHLLRRWALDPQAVLTRADEIARLAAGEPVNTISGMAATRQRAVSDGYQMIAELRRVADRNAGIHSDGQECLGR